MHIAVPEMIENGLELEAGLLSVGPRQNDLIITYSKSQFGKELELKKISNKKETKKRTINLAKIQK